MKKLSCTAVIISAIVHIVLISSLVLLTYSGSKETMGGGGRGSTVVVSVIEDVPGSQSPTKTFHTMSSTLKSSDREVSDSGIKDSAGSGGGEGGGMGSGIGPGSGRGDPRLKIIWKKINRSKYYPWLARKSGWEGAPRVRFAIDADGQVNSVSLIKSCGIQELDDAALETIRRSAPLPHYPKPITLAIRYSLRD